VQRSRNLVAMSQYHRAVACGSGLCKAILDIQRATRYRAVVLTSSPPANRSFRTLNILQTAPLQKQPNQKTT